MGLIVKFIAWVGVVGSVIGCIALWPEPSYYRGQVTGSSIPAMLFLVGGLISSFLTYALGHVVDRVDELHLKFVASDSTSQDAVDAKYPEGNPAE